MRLVICSSNISAKLEITLLHQSVKGLGDAAKTSFEL